MAFTQNQLEEWATPHPDLVDALKERPHPNLLSVRPDATTQDIRHFRAENLGKIRHLYTIPGPIPDQVHEISHTIQARDGYDIPVKIYVPVRSSSRPRPLIVMMHEGGWCMGDTTDEDLNCRLFSRDLDAICINIDYRLAPEHSFPTGLNDCWDVVTWASQTASPTFDILPCDPRVGFIVGGASAGGNLAAVIAQMSRDEALNPPITGQYLCCASLLWPSVVPEKWTAEYKSRSTALHDPVLRPMRNPSGKLERELGVDVRSPRFCPMLAKSFEGLAKTYIQIAGLDPLRDENLIYARELRAQGVEVKLDVYGGYGHVFWANWPEMDASKKFVANTVEGIRWLLEAEHPLKL